MAVHAARAKFWLFSILLAFVALAPAWSRADDKRDDDRHGSRRQIERIVVFGTSLSDPGNVFALTGISLRPQDVRFEDLLIPNAPYALGGHRFSNGPTWIEQLGASLRLARSVAPAYVESRKGSSNYAFGGARARGNAEGSLTVQVSHFLKDEGRHVPSDALYVIEMGGNDVRDALEAALFIPDPVARKAAVDKIIADAIAGIVGNIVRLHAAGARTFFVWGAPNVGRAPAIQFFGPDGVDAATDVSAGFNLALDAALKQHVAGLRKIRLLRFDAFAAVEEIVAGKELFGFTDVATACINPLLPPTFQCARPDQHLFWDGIHPTRAGHRVIALLAGKVLLRELVFDD